MELTVLLQVLVVMVCICLALCFLTILAIAGIIQGGLLLDREMRIPKEWEKADRELKERIKHQYD